MFKKLLIILGLLATPAIAEPLPYIYLQSIINQQVNTNSNGAITGAVLNAVLQDMIDSMYFGGIWQTTPNTPFTAFSVPCNNLSSAAQLTPCAFSPALLQTSPVPANEFLASPSTGSGTLNNRTIVSSDIATALLTPGPIGSGTPNTGAFSSIAFLQLGTGAVQENLLSWAQKFCVTPIDFGGVGDGIADDTTPFDKAVKASIAGIAQAAKCLYLPGGKNFLLPTGYTITMPAGSVGPKIYGDSGYNSKITITNGKLFLTSSTAMFYGSLHDFGVVCVNAGPCLEFSAGNTDAINAFDIDGIVVNNNSANSANIGTQFNGTFNSRIRLISNCNASGNGIGIQFTDGTMNTAQVAAGDCHIGLNLTNDVNAVAANIFNGNDLEVNDIDLQIDGTAVINNTFEGGFYTTTASGNFGVNAIAGSGNILFNPYSGGAGTFCESGTGLRTLGAAASIYVCGGTTSLGDTSSSTTPGAGQVGEILSTTFTNVSTSNGTQASAVTLSLTTGHWACNAFGQTNPAAGTTTSFALFQVSLTNNTIDSLVGEAGGPFSAPAGVSINLSTGTRYINVASTTPVYVVDFVDFAVSTMTASGSITCLRIW